jgi:hypothetical protein
VALTDKYVVLKAEDWTEALLGLQLAGHEEAVIELARSTVKEGSYFVIRDSDVFGAQGLFSYAANIRTAVEFTEATGLSVMTDDVRDRLMELANDLVSIGCDWMENVHARNATAKIPD